MSDPFEPLALPDELRDVASRLRSLRPVASGASEAECMYRAGWQAALAASATPQTLSAANWNKSYFGGVVSGALVSGALATALLFGMTNRWRGLEAPPERDRVAHEAVRPTPESNIAENSTDVASNDPGRDPLEQEAAPVHPLTDELMTTALLSPVARQQWQAVLMQTAEPYISAGADSASANAPTVETLRASPRGLDRTWF